MYEYSEERGKYERIKNLLRMTAIDEEGKPHEHSQYLDSSLYCL